MVEEPTVVDGLRLEVRQTKRFNLVVVYLFGLLLIVPVLLAMATTSLLSVGLLSAMLPLFVALATALFLPVGFGNPYITWLVRSHLPEGGNGMDGYVVQLTLGPRARSGIRALAEDADDVGFLMITRDGLVYLGDAITLQAPPANISKVKRQNIGLRGLFLYERVRVEITGGSGFQYLDFAERSSWLTPGAKRNTRKLHQALLGQLRKKPSVTTKLQAGF
jgi:hypothetical protein